MIQTTNLTKRYNGKPVVNNISFKVAEGERFVLLGKSGSGKTTTLKMLNRLVEPDNGEIYIEGKDVSREDPVKLRRGIGYVIQEHGLFPHYTVRENVRVVPDLLGRDKRASNDRANTLLVDVGLDPSTYARKFPHELSGGERQRVAIARALAAEPPLLLMDEPFSALDPLTRLDVRTMFKELSREAGTTVVVVTHDVGEAIDLGDRICLMEDGMIVQQGEAAELLFSPTNQRVVSFFDEHRFETEMKIITLHDLLPYLQSDPLATDQSYETTGKQVSADLTLYELLADPSEKGTRPLEIMDSEGRAIGRTTPAEIMIAFYRLKEARGGMHG